MLTKKSRNNPILMEARKVLLNHVTIGPDDKFVTVDEFRFQMWGAADGEAPLRFWGVANRKFTYRSDLDNTKVIYKAAKRMTTMGRGINFKSDPDAAGCIVRTYIFYPVVLAFYENDENELELAAFTPRWLTSGIAIRVVARKFNKVMEGTAECISMQKKTIVERFREHLSDKRKAKQEKKDEKKNKKLKKQFDKELEKEVLRMKAKSNKNDSEGKESKESADDEELKKVYEEVLSSDWGTPDEEEKGNE